MPRQGRSGRASGRAAAVWIAAGVILGLVVVLGWVFTRPDVQMPTTPEEAAPADPPPPTAPDEPGDVPATPPG